MMRCSIDAFGRRQTPVLGDGDGDDVSHQHNTGTYHLVGKLVCWQVPTLTVMPVMPAMEALEVLEALEAPEALPL